jgi:transposase InsO family protein
MSMDAPKRREPIERERNLPDEIKAWYFEHENPAKSVRGWTCGAVSWPMTAYVKKDALTAAQARIAELEAALEHIAGAVPSFDYVQAAYDGEGKLDMSQPGSPYDRGKAEAYRTLNEFARRALEAKP